MDKEREDEIKKHIRQAEKLLYMSDATTFPELGVKYASQAAAHAMLALVKRDL